MRYSQPYDETGKPQNVIVNGTNAGEIMCEQTGEGEFKTVSVGANLKKGDNDITVEASWGWSFLDALVIEKGTFTNYSGGGKLSNPKASAQAQALYNFLCDTYGNNVISGQQESTWMGSENYEFDIIKRASGKYPALRGLDYMGDDFLTIIDESHVTVPQIRGMYNGDRARKESLVENGFRLPSAYDNRPLRFDEWESKVKQVVFVSATPADYEAAHSTQVAEQIIRPTGLLDPKLL